MNVPSKNASTFDGAVLGNPCTKYDMVLMYNLCTGQPNASIPVSYKKEYVTQGELAEKFLEIFEISPGNDALTSASDAGLIETVDYFLYENDRIICMFRGHTHNNTVLAPEELAYKFLVDIGAYAYDGNDTSGTWDFSQFDDDWAWGYQVLEWNDTEAHLYHVKTSRQYNASNGVFDFAGAIEDDFTIQIKHIHNLIPSISVNLSLQCCPYHQMPDSHRP